MVKLLFLINNLANGGAERVLVNLVNGMDRTKYVITLRTLVDYGDNKINLNSDIKYESVFHRSFKGINYLHILPKKYIYNKIAGGDFDVIIVYLQGVLTKIVSYAPKYQKTINYLHSDMMKSSFLKGFKNKKNVEECFSAYDATVSVSKTVQNSFIKATGIVDKLYVCYNTFDVKGIIEQSYEKANLLNEPSDCIKICSVGKLNFVKGYDRLLRIAKRLYEMSLEFKLYIIGEGPLYSKLYEYIKDNNLENIVFLIGYDRNPYKYISKSDLFVLASYTEGYSSVVVESIILGVPVITTECAGMTEILGDNNEYGLIVKNDEESLFEGIKDMLTNESLLKHYRLKVKERAAFFNPYESVHKVESLISEVMK